MSKSKGKEPPKILFNDEDPLQECYQDGEGDSYGIARLIDATKHLEPFDCPIASLDLSCTIWNGCNIFELASHCNKVINADITKPIILDWNGCIADGRHRIIKSIIEGKLTIKAVRITWKMNACRYSED